MAQLPASLFILSLRNRVVLSRDRSREHPRSAVFPHARAGPAPICPAGSNARSSPASPARWPSRSARPSPIPVSAAASPSPIARPAKAATPASRCASWRTSSRLSRSQKRIVRRNADLVRAPKSPAEATREQFALLRTYLDSRHSGGGMSDMGLFDYVAMVEETPVNTHIVEYRRPDEDGKPGMLMACALTDVLRDGLSMVYSFFHPGEDARSLGTYMILDHIEAARARGLAVCLSRLLGARAATRWITRRASRRWKRWARRLGTAQAVRRCART